MLARAVPALALLVGALLIPSVSAELPDTTLVGEIFLDAGVAGFSVMLQAPYDPDTFEFPDPDDTPIAVRAWIMDGDGNVVSGPVEGTCQWGPVRGPVGAEGDEIQCEPGGFEVPCAAGPLYVPVALRIGGVWRFVSHAGSETDYEPTGHRPVPALPERDAYCVARGVYDEACPLLLADEGCDLGVDPLAVGCWLVAQSGTDACGPQGASPAAVGDVAGDQACRAAPTDETCDEREASLPWACSVAEAGVGRPFCPI